MKILFKLISNIKSLKVKNRRIRVVIGFNAKNFVRYIFFFL